MVLFYGLLINILVFVSKIVESKIASNLKRNSQVMWLAVGGTKNKCTKQWKIIDEGGLPQENILNPKYSKLDLQLFLAPI